MNRFLCVCDLTHHLPFHLSCLFSSSPLFLWLTVSCVWVATDHEPSTPWRIASKFLTSPQSGSALSSRQTWLMYVLDEVMDRFFFFMQLLPSVATLKPFFHILHSTASDMPSLHPRVFIAWVLTEADSCFGRVIFVFNTFGLWCLDCAHIKRENCLGIYKGLTAMTKKGNFSKGFAFFCDASCSHRRRCEMWIWDCLL